jgi:hypothetical protein
MYTALLVYIDGLYYREWGASTDSMETVNKCIGVLEGHFTEISDLLFSVFAYAICHELSHIVLEHDKQNITVIEREIEADTHAYIMFLRLIQNYLEGNDQEIAITECFQHYVANAPQVLLRLYVTIHSYLSIIYEEKQLQEYPDFLLREKRFSICKTRCQQRSGSRYVRKLTLLLYSTKMRCGFIKRFKSHANILLNKLLLKNKEVNWMC